ncbi:hypothetical protein [Suttonella ornithocola]|uniref:hypothetical protein n=1 Tax=Suttonella ornithocola TaxID=279832 RepID=UPI001B80D949|nr:hypothetical protein [Suttonella ornithocola]
MFHGKKAAAFEMVRVHYVKNRQSVVFRVVRRTKRLTGRKVCGQAAGVVRANG